MDFDDAALRLGKLVFLNKFCHLLYAQCLWQKVQFHRGISTISQCKAMALRINHNVILTPKSMLGTRRLTALMKLSTPVRRRHRV